MSQQLSRDLQSSTNCERVAKREMIGSPIQETGELKKKIHSSSLILDAVMPSVYCMSMIWFGSSVDPAISKTSSRGGDVHYSRTTSWVALEVAGPGVGEGGTEAEFRQKNGNCSALASVGRIWGAGGELGCFSTLWERMSIKTVGWRCLIIVTIWEINWGWFCMGCIPSW